MSTLPVLDIAPLLAGADGRAEVARALDRACRQDGFFYVVGHGLDPELGARLERAARAFFGGALADKQRLAMRHGGRAWRGYFPVGAECTSGRADMKEGLYFGEELGPDEPRVRARLPLHGPNLFPADGSMREEVLAWMAAMRAIADALLQGLALGLGLEACWFTRHGYQRPTSLFRLFHYPPLGAADEWSVAEHSDYGGLTLLHQDDVGGLEVHSERGWIAAPPLADSLVCNLGDMLQRATLGHYRATPHRVRNVSDRARLGCAYFHDPDFEQPVALVPGLEEVTDDAELRWDASSVQGFQGRYGDYLLTKVRRVFPSLADEVLSANDCGQHD